MSLKSANKVSLKEKIKEERKDSDLAKGEKKSIELKVERRKQGWEKKRV